MNKEYNLNDLRVSTLSKRETINYLKSLLGNTNGYVCVTNTRTAFLSAKDSNYCEIQNKSLFIIPDGMPLVWLGKLAGEKTLERISGPELFQTFLQDPEPKLKHFLLGDTEEVLEQLKLKIEKEYKATIVGSYSPPFAHINDYDYKAIGDMVNESGCNVVWLALGSPKQDIFASKLTKYTDKKIILNVGAAFRFILGEFNMPSGTLQKLGLTGVYWRLKDKPLEFLKKYPQYFIFLIGSAYRILNNRILKIE